MSHSIFPTLGAQFLSAFVHFIGVTFITFFFSGRVFAEDLMSRQGWKSVTWPRLLVLLVLLDSWLFTFSAGLLIFGVGMELNHNSCAAGIYLCVIFYTSSKVLIYIYLAEKVYRVWGNGIYRLKSPVYMICVTTVVCYVGVILTMVFGRIASFRPQDGVCVLGLKPTASLPLLSFDLYINVLMTFLFVWPLLALKVSTPALRRVAIRTLVTATAGLTTSTINIGLLILFKGREVGWLCLGCCTVDVLLNATAMFWVTSGRRRSSATAAKHPITGTVSEYQCTFDTVADLPYMERERWLTQVSQSHKPASIRSTSGPARLSMSSPPQVIYRSTSSSSGSPGIPGSSPTSNPNAKDAPS